MINTLPPQIMKTIFILISFILLWDSAYSQIDKSIEFSEVINVDSSLTKKQLFKRARLWFSDYYRDSKEVLQFTDEEVGELQGAAVFKFTFPMLISHVTATIDYRVNVITKNGKFKVKVYQFINKTSYAGAQNIRKDGIGLITEERNEELVNMNVAYLPKSEYPKLLEKCKYEFKNIVKSLTEYLNKSPKETDDW